MIQLMEPRENRTSHGNLDGLLDWISLVTEDGTAMGYSVIFIMMK